MAQTQPQDPRPDRIEHVLVVDDHPLFCEALAMTLRAVAGIRRIDTLGTLGEALRRLERDPPDAIVLDLNLPDVEGFDGLVQMHATAPAIPILVVSSIGGARAITAALDAGAAGFVPKNSGRDAFRAAFAALRRGTVYTPPDYTPPAGTAVSDDSGASAVQRLSSLTRQQATILRLICEGKLNKQIAHDLSIAETTVKAHVTAIMRKLEVQNRTQALLIAREASFDAFMQDG